MLYIIGDIQQKSHETSEFECKIPPYEREANHDSSLTWETLMTACKDMYMVPLYNPKSV